MTPQEEVLGQWNYGVAPQFPYGEETSYRKAIEFLDGPHVIEDWGCGTAWARKFVRKGRYVGVDGSWSMHCDMVRDLRIYRSQADAILLRHVLDHNFEWKRILQNALESFRRKLALVIFTPFAESTRTIAMNQNPNVPDISFRKEDLLELIRPYPFTEEAFRSDTQYGAEHLFYVARSPADLKRESGVA